jgi:hypothetical protein
VLLANAISGSSPRVDEPSSISRCGSRRSSQDGKYQLRRPSVCMIAGTSTVRTISASTRIADAIPSPIILIVRSVLGVNAAKELQFRHRLPELGRAVLNEAACRSCVILAPAAFAALAEHAGAIHVRLRAPIACRMAAYRRDHLIDRGRAAKAIKHDDHLQSAWVRSLYHLDLDDERNFSLVLDASRFSPERLVEILLAAGGIPVAAATAL